MYREIKFGNDARDEIKDGVNIVADAVVSTLGPRGQNVIFEESMFPTITKDGVTVAQNVLLEDKFQNMGVMLAREAAENTNREAGDGTTTTIALLRNIFNEGHKAVASGMNPVLIKRGMDKACDIIVKELDSYTKTITTDVQKKQIATISANNDKEIGTLIHEVLDKVGTNGVITVSQSNALKTDVEYVSGLKIDSGLLSHVFINNAKKLTVELDNPTIIVCTDEIVMASQITTLIQDLLVQGKKQFVLFANKIEGQALAFLIQNYMQGKFMCVPVRIPSFGDYQKDLVYDLATLTQSTVLGAEEAKSTEEATAEDCGTCAKLVIDQKSTVITGAKGDVKERIEETNALLKKEKDVFRKEKLKERLGRLTGSIANIQVGGASESEQMEIRYRIEDALNATKCAIEEGIVEGGGVALLRCSNFNIESEDAEFNVGAEIVRKALSTPIKAIVKNGGLAGDVIAGKVIEGELGYNALTNEFEDLFKSGIVDPKKVVKTELINAVATAGILLTSNVAIANKEEKENV